MWGGHHQDCLVHFVHLNLLSLSLPPSLCIFLSVPLYLSLSQRKTKKIVDQFTTKEAVFELQSQEQQRALDLQRRAIEKVQIRLLHEYVKFVH